MGSSTQSDAPAADASGVVAAAPHVRPARRSRSEAQKRLIRLFWQILIVAVFLGAWQGVPEIPGITKVSRFLDPFFISSPSSVATTVWDLMTGTSNAGAIWPEVGITVGAALVGSVAGVIVGGVGGLLCGGNEELYKVVRPLVMALNAVPRITLVPIIVVVVGASPTADALSAAMLVVFIVFYNAVEGARSVSPETIEFARLLGASKRTRLLRVRGPYSLAWVFASLPNAISFGLVGAVTTELFTGSRGLGQVMITAVDTADASLTFAVVVILAVVGIILFQGVDFLRRKSLSWWEAG
jgi:NitT/TauT family transport system permease protein